MKKVRLAQNILYGSAGNTVNVNVNGYVYIKGTVSFLENYATTSWGAEVAVEKIGDWDISIYITGQKNDTKMFYLPIGFLNIGDVITIMIPAYTTIAFEVYAEVDELS